MSELRSEAISNTLVGTDRTNISSRAFSSSSDFAQTYRYALMNLSPENVGRILSYQNTPGRSMHVLENEWGTFSHVRKTDHFETYLMIPVGEPARENEMNGSTFYICRDYDLFRIANPGWRNTRDLKVAKCNPIQISSVPNSPTRQNEFSTSQIACQDFSERAKKIVANAAAF